MDLFFFFFAIILKIVSEVKLLSKIVFFSTVLPQYVVISKILARKFKSDVITKYYFEMLRIFGMKIQKVKKSKNSK